MAAPAAAQVTFDPHIDAATLAPVIEGMPIREAPSVNLHTVSEEKPIDPYAYRRGLMSAIGLYEYNPPSAVESGYRRPHYTLGFRSETMRDALNLTGVHAESCIAPMVRLRARPGPDGNVNPSLTLIARCTFE